MTTLTIKTNKGVGHAVVFTDDIPDGDCYDHRGILKTGKYVFEFYSLDKNYELIEDGYETLDLEIECVDFEDRKTYVDYTILAQLKNGCVNGGGTITFNSNKKVISHYHDIVFMQNPDEDSEECRIQDTLPLDTFDLSTVFFKTL